MTEFIVSTAAITFEQLDWDLSPPEGTFVDSGTLDISLFTAAQHYPLGYIKSGILLGKVTAGGLIGPYLDAAVDGRTVCVGLMRASVPVIRQNGTTRTKIGVAWLRHGVVSQARLPHLVGDAPGGGYVDANARADLPLIDWRA